MTNFHFHTPPLAHQLSVWEDTWHLKAYALFWDMGLGKSKHIIDVACKLFQEQLIKGVLIVAPNGVHVNWNVPGEGLQAHMPPELRQLTAALIWHSNKARHKSTVEALQRLERAQFPWLIMAYDTFVSESGYEVAERFLAGRPCLMALDESHRIKTKSAIRSKRIAKLGKLAPYRRILTGTPAEQKPFDVYNQVEWAFPGYWRQQGFASYIAFKHYLADWRRQRSPMGHEFEVQVTDKNGKPLYKNLDALSRMLKPISSRLLKTDVLDLPPKVYTRMHYEMTPAQRKLYDAMERDYFVWLNQVAPIDPDDPTTLPPMVSADLALVRQLRLHQIAMGYVTDDEGTINSVVDPNPALDLLSEIVQDLAHPAIVWCRFRKDVDLIMERHANSAVRYDGSTSAEDRTRALAAVQAGDVPLIVATSAMAEGVTLTAALTSIYYSQDRKLGKRKQSEDRNYRIGQQHSVQYIDLVCPGTISEIILDGLMHGEEVAAAALGEKIRKKYL